MSPPQRQSCISQRGHTGVTSTKSTNNKRTLLRLNPGDTLTFQRFESPEQRLFGFYLPMEYWDSSWQQARTIFQGDYRLDSVNLKRQPKGYYRATFYYRMLAGTGATDAAAILANIRSLAPANVTTHATNILS